MAGTLPYDFFAFRWFMIFMKIKMVGRGIKKTGELFYKAPLLVRFSEEITLLFSFYIPQDRRSATWYILQDSRYRNGVSSTDVPYYQAIHT